VTEVVDRFSLQNFKADLQGIAPSLWSVMVSASTRDERGSGSIRDKELVFVTICAMFSMLCSQKANNFQVVIGLFLLGSGALKREMEVLAHVGFSVSYNSIIDHIHLLSAENVQKFRKAIKDFMCSIVWDNLNIAFHIGEQQLGSKAHLDSGTTATLLLGYDPSTKGKISHGTLPLSLKPPRISTQQLISNHKSLLLISPEDAITLDCCSLWLLKSLATQHISEFKHLKCELEPCPSVDQIEPHVTEQYPLSAMYIDESSLDGTSEVYSSILHQLQVSNEDIKKHGLLFVDGDLLTDSLVDKVNIIIPQMNTYIIYFFGLQAVVRRFGLFHCKMAGCRMVINEHWGKPNSRWPGGLWWENTQLLKRKPMIAGWKSKKAAPWKQFHKLISISLPAHILDGFRIFCGHDNFQEWAKQATIEEFNVVAQLVFENLFTSAAYEEQLDSFDSPDTVLLNSILYNRDSLLYWLFATSIKAGDIGRVVLVLRIWMVMMRTSKTMPRYADAIFETLGQISYYPELYSSTFSKVIKRNLFLHNWLVNLSGKPGRFKEIDLLQEHQNLWLKVVYSAKGSNKSWSWLSMISVCIYSLRDAMRIVQSGFNITHYGVQHTVPDMNKEIQTLADGLKSERIQEYVADRLANDSVLRVRDLLQEGSEYANKKSAFEKFKNPTYKLENLGIQDQDAGDLTRADEEESEVDLEDYEATMEDLAVDEDESYEFADDLIQAASEMTDFILGEEQ
ncbi:hypothetical protein K435DRAFT_668218, partial [Dendrothele bispora CBS 962.96]